MIANWVMVSVVAALGGDLSDAGVASGQVHGAPIGLGLLVDERTPKFDGPPVGIGNQRLQGVMISTAGFAGEAEAMLTGGGAAAATKKGPAQAAPAAAAPAKSPPAPAAAPAMTAEVKSLVERMQSFYEKTQDFTAKFQQDYSYKAFKRKQTSTGTVAFKKPGLMRWEYLQPSPRTFVVSSDKVYAYDPSAMTLTKGTFDSSQLSASVTFLWGRGNLADEFSIQKVACKDCKGTMLELTPKKPDPRFRQVRLEVDPKTAQVRRSIVIDPDGSQNAITFLEMKTNTGLTQDAFKLAPPANTQIIDMTRK